jgi:hypothetical protein
MTVSTQVSGLSEKDILEMESCARDLISDRTLFHHKDLMPLAIRIEVTLSILGVFRDSISNYRSVPSYVATRQELVSSLNDLCLTYVDSCRLLSYSK